MGGCLRTRRLRSSTSEPSINYLPCRENSPVDLDSPGHDNSVTEDSNVMATSGSDSNPGDVDGMSTSDIADKIASIRFRFEEFFAIFDMESIDIVSIRIRIEKLLARFGMETSHSVSNPGDVDGMSTSDSADKITSLGLCIEELSAEFNMETIDIACLRSCFKELLAKVVIRYMAKADFDGAKRLLMDDKHKLDDDGATKALWICCFWANSDSPDKEKRFVEIAELLLKRKGGLINKPYRDQTNIPSHIESTPVQTVCISGGSVPMLKLLLSHNNPECDLTITNFEGETAIQKLLRIDNIGHINTRLKMLEVLSTHKQFCACAAIRNNEGDNALDAFLRVRKWHSDAIETCKTKKELLRILLGAKGLAKQSGCTFALAAMLTSPSTFNIFTDYDISINDSLHNNESALICAIERNSLSKFELIWKYKPDLSLTFNQKTPLKLAITNHCNARIIELLSQNISDEELSNILRECLPRFYVELFLKESGSQKLADKLQNIIKCKQADGKLHEVGREVYSSWPSLRPHISSKISPNRSYNSNCKQASEIVKENQRFMTKYEPETDEIKQAIDQLFEDASNFFVEHAEVSFMKFKHEVAGSMAEGTRCYAPSEWDCLCIFSDKVGSEISPEPLQQSDDDQAENTVWAQIGSPWCSLAKDDYGRLDPRTVGQTFYKFFDMYTQKATEQGKNFGNLYLFKYGFQLQEKISRIQLLWQGTAFPNLVIHVDTVPAFEISLEGKEEELPLNQLARNYLLIAKSSRFNHPTDLPAFHKSYKANELDIIQNLPKPVLHGFIIAKAVRLAMICGPGLDLSTLHVDEEINIEDYITSYILKTILFQLLQERKRTGVNRDKCMYSWALQIYRELISCLSEKEIVKWYDFEESLLSCEYHEDDGGMCCRKRLIMQALAEKMCVWLVENTDELHGGPKCTCKYALLHNSQPLLHRFLSRI